MLQYPMFPYYVPLLQCLQTLCSSVSHKSPTPLAWREAVPQKRENQINTLVLKNINFTINIIELSYYRTIDTLNQSKNAPVVHFISLKVGTDALVCPYFVASYPN